jgi:acid phosphatase (class A)
MLSLELLFEETRKDKKNQKESFDASLDRLNLAISDIPVVYPPDSGSIEHKEDLNAVKFCITNPTFAQQFLKISDKNAEKVFKMYAEQTGLKINEKQIKKLCSHFDKLIKYLKNFYMRPRPKHSLEIYDSEFDWQSIRNNKSMSYPSGHTAMAYFVANIIANENPSVRDDLETIAAMIGQTRIDNGVHYPTDVEFGRYIGELASERLIDGKKMSNKRISERVVCDFFKNKWSQHENYSSDLANFVHRSNEIERYPIEYSECLEASNLFLKGYPVDYCTENKFIRSHLAGLRESVAVGKIDSLDKIIMIHKSLGDDVIENDLGAGALRNFKHSSRSGVRYPDPGKLVDCISDFLKYDGDSWSSHVVYEWIHPFCDGNGRSGRILLANKLDYDFNKLLALIGKDYLPRIIKDTNTIAMQFSFN